MKLYSARRVRAVLLILSALLLPAVHAAPEYRALWVDVFHPGLRSQAEADAMLATARQANYNAVFIQVRKSCDAYYNSGIEPKNPSVKGDFDPLAYILQQAHGSSPRLEVHAWLVAYRARIPYDNLWQNPRHVFSRHPEWLSVRSNGSKADGGENSGRYYLDPGVPQVVDYNLTVVRDILSRYNVDGIHFDYIRYPESSGAGNVWGYNPIALERFNRLYDRTGKPAADDPEFNEFRRRQIYDQVRKVYAHVRAWRPRVKVSAATIAWGDVDKGFERTDAYGKIMQDWQAMAIDGWLDLMMPMNYKREHIPAQARAHRNWAAFLGQLALQSGRFGLNGVDGEELNGLESILAQIQATRSLPGIAGIASYCYAQPRAGSAKRPTPDLEFFKAIREKVFPSVSAVPEATWLTRPRDGYIKGVVTRGGKPVDGAIVRLGARTTHTDGTGFYAFARVAPGTQVVRAEDGKGLIGTRETSVQAGGVAEAPIGG